MKFVDPTVRGLGIQLFALKKQNVFECHMLRKVSFTIVAQLIN